MGSCLAKHDNQSYGCYVALMPSPLIRISRDLVIPLFFKDRRGDTPTNVDFPYKCKCLLQKVNFYSVFRASPMSMVS